MNKNTKVLVVWGLSGSDPYWKILSAYSVYPMWALNRKKTFSLQDRLYFSCRASKLPKDWWLFKFLFQISFLTTSHQVSGETAHHRLMCLSWLGHVSAPPPTCLKWQTHQNSFLQCCRWVVISPSPWEWAADIGAVGSVFSLGQCLSLRLWSAPAAPQRSAANSALASS